MVLLLTIMMQSCSTTTQSLADGIKNQLPIAVPGIGELNSVYAEGNDLVFVTDASARYLNYDIVSREDNKNMIGDNVLIMVSKLGIIDDLYSTKSNIVYRFEWNDGRKIDAKFSNSEILSRAERNARRFSR